MNLIFKIGNEEYLLMYTIYTSEIFLLAPAM